MVSLVQHSRHLLERHFSLYFPPVDIFCLFSLKASGESSTAEALRTLQTSVMPPRDKKPWEFPKRKVTGLFFHGIASKAWGFPKFDSPTNTHHYFKFLLSYILHYFHWGMDSEKGAGPWHFTWASLSSLISPRASIQRDLWGSFIILTHI